MQTGTIGVVIRTLNESELLATCLDALHAQHCPAALDVLVVDSGSTDATLEIARAHGARTSEIAAADFDYSKALNLGIGEVAGDLVLVLSAHAIPLDDRWIESLVAPFEDPRVAGVASRQVPWPDAPFDEVHRLARAFGETRRAYTAATADDVLFSNAASCIRRSVWRDEPFTLAAAEDIEWAQRVVRAGWTVVYEPAATVYHSHKETPRAQARRLIDLNRGGTLATGARTWRRTLREAAGYLYRDARLVIGLEAPLRRKLGHIAHVVRMVSYYVIDFSRSGSTAQLRRDDAGRRPRRPS